MLRALVALAAFAAAASAAATTTYNFAQTEAFASTTFTQTGTTLQETSAAACRAAAGTAGASIYVYTFSSGQCMLASAATGVTLEGPAPTAGTGQEVGFATTAATGATLVTAPTDYTTAAGADSGVAITYSNLAADAAAPSGNLRQKRKAARRERRRLRVEREGRTGRFRIRDY